MKNITVFEKLVLLKLQFEEIIEEYEKEIKEIEAKIKQARAKIKTIENELTNNKQKIADAKYYQKNKEKIKKKVREYYFANKEKIAERKKKWYLNKKMKCKKENIKLEIEDYARLFMLMIELDKRRHNFVFVNKWPNKDKTVTITAT